MKTVPDEEARPAESASRRPIRNFAMRRLSDEKTQLLLLLACVALLWLPRLQGPIDLRWDGGVYYILGTSLAQGKGYKLLNEPGEIDAIQYPPLLPLIIAGYQIALGTDDPTIVGWWLRITFFPLFALYIFLIYRFLRSYLPGHWAFPGSVLALFSLHVYFLSDLCFPELLFGISSLLFVGLLRRETTALQTFGGGLLAAVSYGLRTVGLAAFLAWALESIVKKQYKWAALKALLILLPIVSWQMYIRTVENSEAYRQPAYQYQRAPYMFYNVTYARNFTLEEPFAPEQGPAEPIVRTLHNALLAPVNLGESVSTVRGYWQILLQSVFGRSPVGETWRQAAVFVLLYLLGLLVVVGIGLQVWRREWAVPLFLGPYLGAMCFTPFPEQYSRYLMPVVPLLVLSLMLSLKYAAGEQTGRRRRWGHILSTLVIATAFLLQLFCLQHVFRYDFEPVAYVDRSGRQVDQRLFFYQTSHSDFDACIDFLQRNAGPQEIVAAGTPHWVYLRTGLKSVMPPMEINPIKAQGLLDGVPVKYLIAGKDVIKSERYLMPVLENMPQLWERVFVAPSGEFVVYRRTGR